MGNLLEQTRPSQRAVPSSTRLSGGRGRRRRTETAVTAVPQVGCKVGVVARILTHIWAHVSMLFRSWSISSECCPNLGTVGLESVNIGPHSVEVGRPGASSDNNGDEVSLTTCEKHIRNVGHFALNISQHVLAGLSGRSRQQRPAVKHTTRGTAHHPGGACVAGGAVVASSFAAAGL